MKYAVKKLVNHKGFATHVYDQEIQECYWQFVAMVNFEPIILRKWLDFYHKNDYKLFIKTLEVFLTDGEIKDLGLHEKFEIDIEMFEETVSTENREQEWINFIIYGDNGLINIKFDKTYNRINTMEDLKKQAIKEF